VVRLINDHQLKKVTRQQVQPSRNGADAGYLHRMGQVHATAGLYQAMRDAHGLQAPAGLLQQLSAMHQDADAVAFARSGLGNVAENTSFPAAGAKNH
jgi:hypothetical protein